MQTSSVPIANFQYSKLGPHIANSPRQLVIFLHGFGANGEDLLSLGQSWMPELPYAEFMAPDAPMPCALSPFEKSYQWFDLNDMAPETIEKGIAEALPALNAFIDSELQKRGLSDSELFLVGFSQGAMMALAVGLSRPKPCSGILGYSGAFFYPPNTPILSKPDVFLIHGDADDVIAVELGMHAAATLSDFGVPVQSYIARGVGHFIDADGQRLGVEFIQKHLS